MGISTSTWAPQMLPHDPSTPLREPLEWLRITENVWRSTDEEYQVVLMNPTAYGLDKDSPAPFQLRGLMHLSSNSLGYHIDEVYNLEQAFTTAVRHRYTLESKAASVPEDYPAEAMERFFWPISEGTSRGALVVTRNDEGQRVAQLVGMSRGSSTAGPDGEVRYEPATWAEIVLD